MPPLLSYTVGMSVGNRGSHNKEYDVFISHAAEDKEHFVRPLAKALVAKGLRVWYDEFELRVGDSLREKIDLGLVSSRFGVVVISPSFFRKRWTQYELNGLTERQMSGEKVILPVWHRVTKDEVLEQAPPLANLIALVSPPLTIEEIASEIAESTAEAGSPSVPAEPDAAPTRVVRREFGVFYVAPAHTEELARGEVPESSFLSFRSDAGHWVSMVSGDKELEYILDEARLRVRLDWGGHLEGDEIIAQQLVSGEQPFALTIRPAGANQLYLPTVGNTSPSPLWGRNPSGWMVFDILK